MMYDLFEFHAARDNTVRSTDRASYVVRRLMDLLSTGVCERRRSVGYFAAQLNVTPKYLSDTVRRQTGLSVTHFIDVHTVPIIKRYLDDASLSVTMIAERMDFSSPSYFARVTCGVCSDSRPPSTVLHACRCALSADAHQPLHRPFCRIAARSLLLRSLMRVFDYVEYTSARQNASKLAFALAYSYICNHIIRVMKRLLILFLALTTWPVAAQRVTYTRMAEARNAATYPSGKAPEFQPAQMRSLADGRRFVRIEGDALVARPYTLDGRSERLFEVEGGRILSAALSPDERASHCWSCFPRAAPRPASRYTAIRLRATIRSSTAAVAVLPASTAYATWPFRPIRARWPMPRTTTCICSTWQRAAPRA